MYVAVQVEQCSRGSAFLILGALRVDARVEEVYEGNRTYCQHLFVVCIIAYVSRHKRCKA